MPLLTRSFAVGSAVWKLFSSAAVSTSPFPGSRFVLEPPSRSHPAQARRAAVAKAVQIPYLIVSLLSPPSLSVRRISDQFRCKGENSDRGRATAVTTPELRVEVPNGQTLPDEARGRSSLPACKADPVGGAAPAPRKYIRSDSLHRPRENPRENHGFEGKKVVQISPEKPVLLLVAFVLGYWIPMEVR